MCDKLLILTFAVRPSVPGQNLPLVRVGLHKQIKYWNESKFENKSMVAKTTRREKRVK